MTAAKFNLPFIKGIRIENMTTFPQDRRASFDKGINVIFGPNRAGKSTLVNAIRYGIFGLSLCHIPEEVEIKYFSARVNQTLKKSLDISIVYSIQSNNVAVKRVIYSSGSPTISADVSLESGKSLAAPDKILNLEGDYDEYLKNKIGISNENLPFISDLLFADEARRTFLWSDDIEKFVLDLLTSAETAERLRHSETNLRKEREALKKTEEQNRKLLFDINDKQMASKSLRAELNKFEHSDIGKSVAQRDTLLADLQVYRGKISNGTFSLEIAVRQKLTMLAQVEENLKKQGELKFTKDRLTEDAIKAFLNAEDPDTYHLGRCIYHDKKCPICYSDLSTKVDSRLSGQKCPLCGEGDLPGSAGSAGEIKLKIKELEKEEASLISIKSDISDKISSIEKQIAKLGEEIAGCRSIENNILGQLGTINANEEHTLRKLLMEKELKNLQSSIDESVAKQAVLQSQLEAQKAKIEGLERIYTEAIRSSKRESADALAKVKQRFASFITTATNGEITATLSSQLVPNLEGRSPIFSPALVSTSEKFLMDYAFRMAIISVCAEKTGTVASILLETPDEGIDESFVSSFCKALKHLSSNLSIVVTTFNSEFVHSLLKGYDIKGKDSRRFTNLLPVEGSLTQNNHYQPKLFKYISESKNA